MKDIYLDNNATTSLRPAVRERLFELFSSPWGNPSSSHSWGVKARSLVEGARETAGSFLNCDPENIVFTSSGSESNSQVLLSASNAGPGLRYISSKIEHASILRNLEFLEARGAEVVYIPVDRDGRIDTGALETELRKGPAFVTLQWVNNETGVFQDIPGIGELCRRYGAILHTDAAQALGKIPVDLETADVDFLTFTGHKIHAPQGVGGIFAKETKRIVPLLWGGDQEHGLRAGTENLWGIAGLGMALEDRLKNWETDVNSMKKCRDFFETAITGETRNVVINGDPSRRVCNTTNLLFPGIDGRALVARLDNEGVICSQSSACTSRIPEPSHVLTAMGLSEEDGFASVRFSVSADTTMVEAERAASIVADTAKKLEAFAAALFG